MWGLVWHYGHFAQLFTLALMPSLCRVNKTMIASPSPVWWLVTVVLVLAQADGLPCGFLGIKLRSFGRAVSEPNHWAISPVPRFIYLVHRVILLGFGNGAWVWTQGLCYGKHSAMISSAWLSALPHLLSLLFADSGSSIMPMIWAMGNLTLGFRSPVHQRNAWLTRNKGTCVFSQHSACHQDLAV